MNENTENNSDVLWNILKNTKVSMFGLPPQRLENLCEKKVVEPNNLYVLPKATSLLPALEETLGNKYTVELFNKYIKISKAIGV